MYNNQYDVFVETIKVSLRLLRVQKLPTPYFRIIKAQSSISELKRTKPNHDCSILFDIIRFGSISFGHRTPLNTTEMHRTSSMDFLFGVLVS